MNDDQIVGYIIIVHLPFAANWLLMHFDQVKSKRDFLRVAIQVLLGPISFIGLGARMFFQYWKNLPDE